MIGLTHWIWWATAVLSATYMFPEYFKNKYSTWIFILSFYVSQLPDIDIKWSDISKNIFVKIAYYIMSPFIWPHRSHQTHSFFWTFMYLLITLPLISVFSVAWWLLLWIAYFSHLVLDYFNPTWVPLFYLFPIIKFYRKNWKLKFTVTLNTQPRYRSIYNTIPQIIMFWKDIKFDWVWVMTWWKLEKVITIFMYLGFIGLIWLQYEMIINKLLLDSLFLAMFPIISVIWYLFVLYDLYNNDKKIFKKAFKYIIWLWFIIHWFFLYKFWNLYEPLLFPVKIFYSIILLTLPILFLLAFNLINNIKNIFFYWLLNLTWLEKKWQSLWNIYEKIWNHKVLVNLFFFIILMTSLLYVNKYQESYIWYTKLTKEDFTQEKFINKVKEVYTDWYNDLNKETGVIDKVKTLNSTGVIETVKNKFY